MRHKKSGRKLNRTSAHRGAMLRNMTCSLLRHEQIVTTIQKAKELRRVAEPLITLGKDGTLANRRLAFSRLRDREVVGKLFNDLGPRFVKRPGGYLRILKMGYRAGDSATLALVQLVERKVPETTAPADEATGEKATKAKATKTKKTTKAKATKATKATKAAKTAKTANAE